MSDAPTYEQQPNLTRLETSVVEQGTHQGRPYAVLTDTVFYPEGGGQPYDRGTVNDVEIIDVQKVDGRIYHFLEAPLATGPVVLELDWRRRFDHMQQHTAQHLLTAVAADRFGWQTTAFHLGERVSDIELDVQSLEKSELRSLEAAVAVEVRAARRVAARRVSPDAYEQMEVRSRGLPTGHSGDVRLVEIEGIDLNTCGGTHCGSTAEIEAIALLDTESVRGGTRVFYVAGERLRSRIGAEVSRTAELRTLLGVSDDEVVDAVEARVGQLKDNVRSIRRMEEELASTLACQIATESEAVSVRHFEGRGLSFLQRLGREIVTLDPSRVALLTSDDSGEGFFLLSAGDEADINVSEVGPRIASALKGKGGGSGNVFQGRVTQLSNLDEALALLR